MINWTTRDTADTADSTGVWEEWAVQPDYLLFRKDEILAIYTRFIVAIIEIPVMNQPVYWIILECNVFVGFMYILNIYI